MAEYKENNPPVQEINFDFRNNSKCNPHCACDNSACPRHGNCRLCVEFHRLSSHPSTCQYCWKWKNDEHGLIRIEKRFSEL